MFILFFINILIYGIIYIIANYSQNYKAKYIRLEQDGYAVVDLTPKKSKSYYKIRFYIHAKTGLVKKMEMFNYDGSRGEYSASQINALISK